MNPLLLLELNGKNYTCTSFNPWCIRSVDDQCEILFPGNKGLNDYLGNKRASLNSSLKSFWVVMPVNISKKSVPLLSQDRYMMRPPRQRMQTSDLEEHVNILIIGYNFGWGMQIVEDKLAVVAVNEKIVPVIKSATFLRALGFLCFPSS